MGDLLNIEDILDIDEMDSIYNQEEDEETHQESDDNTETTEDDESNDHSESVGSEEENIEDREDTTPKGNSSSPNFYSSIAKALKEDSIFPDLEDDDVNEVTDADSFKEAIEKQIKAALDARQQRIDRALNAGIEMSDIKKYEGALDFLEGITDDVLESEDEKGETLRKNLIYQDFINKGYSKERAAKEVKKSFDAGTDIEDAKDALQENKKHYKNLYDGEVTDAEKKEKDRKEELQKNVEKLKKSVLEDEKFIGDLVLGKSIRKKVYDNISKPSYKDPDTGNYLTELQRYQKEHNIDFVKNVGILFTLTDGFKNLNNLVKSKVQKEMKKGLKDLEHTLNNTTRDSDGNLRFVTGVSDDNSYIGSNWDLAF